MPLSFVQAQFFVEAVPVEHYSGSGLIAFLAGLPAKRASVAAEKGAAVRGFGD